MGIKRVKAHARKGKMVKSYTAKKKDKMSAKDKAYIKRINKDNKVHLDRWKKMDSKDKYGGAWLPDEKSVYVKKEN